jgi:hypothetical protein
MGDKWLQVARVKTINEKIEDLKEQAEFREKQALQRQYLEGQMSSRNASLVQSDRIKQLEN